MSPTGAAAAAVAVAAAVLYCRISRASGGFAGALPSSPFFGPSSGSVSPGSDTRSRLRAEIAAELLLMGVGRHTYFLDGLMRPQPYADEDADYEATDERQHTQAAIALHLLQQLRFMEAMDEMLTAAADETAASVLEYRTAMQVFYEMLQRKVERDGATLAAFMDADAEVRRWLQAQPATRNRYAASRTVAAFALLRQLGRESAFLRRLAVCTLFLEAAGAGAGAADERRYSKLARNVLKLARKREAARHIERIFQTAVDETANEGTDLRDRQRTLDVLFQKLVDKMRGDAVLNSESMRRKIRADLR